MLGFFISVMLIFILLHSYKSGFVIITPQQYMDYNPVNILYR